jgi:hypothetical protein
MNTNQGQPQENPKPGNYLDEPNGISVQTGGATPPIVRQEHTIRSIPQLETHAELGRRTMAIFWYLLS